MEGSLRKEVKEVDLYSAFVTFRFYEVSGILPP